MDAKFPSNAPGRGEGAHTMNSCQYCQVSLNPLSASGESAPSLLELLGRHLIRGRSYRLGWSGQPSRISCEVGEEDPEREEVQIEQLWDPRAVSFTVVAGIRKPRLTMSVTVPSSICQNPGTPAFHVVMLVASLERRLVTVNVQRDDFVEL